MSAGISKNLDKLFSKVKHLEERVNDGTVNLYPFIKMDNKPYALKEEGYRIPSKYWQEQIPLNRFEDESNISFVSGSDINETGYHLGVIDIDGYKKLPEGKTSGKYWYDEELHKTVCADLYRILQHIDIKSINEKTWSHGYHITFYTSETITTDDNNFISVLNFIYFPEDYHIEELQGKSLLNNKNISDMVEIFCKPNKQRIICYPSMRKHTKKDSNNNKETREGTYEIITEDPDIDILIDNPVSDIETKIVECFKKYSNFIFDKEAYEKAKNNQINTTETLNDVKEEQTFKEEENSCEYILTDKAFNEIVENLSQIIKHTNGKHYNVIIALEGALSNLGLNKEDRKRLLNTAISKSDDNSQHHKQVEFSLKNTNKEKTGFNTIQSIASETTPYVKEIKKIVNNIKNTAIKKLVKTVEEKTDPLIVEINKGLYGITDEKQKETYIRGVLKLIERVQYPILNENIYYMYYENPQKRKLALKVAKKIPKDLNIKVVHEDNEVKYYAYTEEGYYIQIHKNDLQLLIEKATGLNYDSTMCKNILESIVQNDDPNYHLLQVSNGVIDTNDLNNIKFIKNEAFDFKNELVVKKLGLKNEKGEYTLLKYDPNASLNDNPQERTLVENSLRKILIPKGSTNYNFIIDRLQRAGFAFLGVNDTKTITYNYDPRGNAGKSLVKSMMRKILNDLCTELRPDQLKDKFGYDLLKRTHLIVIDETNPDELNKVTESLKILSSPGSSIDTREMYSTLKTTITHMGNTEIFSNHLMNLGSNDMALIGRLNIIRYPNLFRSKAEIEKGTYDNAYEVDEELYDKISKDIDGLSWFLSASINEAKKILPNRSFLLAQTTEETLDILLDNDVYQKFVYIYLEKTDVLTIKNNEIKEVFIDYLEREGKSIQNQNDINRQLGIAISNIFGKEIKVRKKNGTYYKLRIKDLSEIENEKKEFLQIVDPDDLNPDEFSMIDRLNDKSKIIYDCIKKGKLNSIDKLQENYESWEVNTIVKRLIGMNLIEAKEQTSIADY